MVLEKTLKSSLDCKKIQPVHSEGDQPWDFFGGTDAEAETPHQESGPSQLSALTSFQLSLESELGCFVD